MSQKKVYNKMCVLFAGFVKGVEENCLSQTGEVSLHPLTLEIALGQSLRPRGATLPSPACDLQFSSTPLTEPANNAHILSSPRVKPAGPKGLCAESARAVTGRRCPHSGKGEDFLTGQPDFFTETAVTSERKVEKSFPRWEINRHAEG